MITFARNQPTEYYNLKNSDFNLDLYRPFYNHFGYTYLDLINRSRKIELVMVRACIIRHLFNYVGLSYIRIGEIFGRDRTTIMHLNKKESKYDLTFKHYWEIFENLIIKGDLKWEKE